MKEKFIQQVILAEGPTEEAFVKEVLNPYLNSFGIWASPTVINTKIAKNGPNFKGGSVSFGKAKRDLDNLANDNSIFITTLFDYYGLGDFPGQEELRIRPKPIYEAIKLLEENLETAIGHTNFKAFIQPHEFEALLFASIEGFKSNFSDEPKFIEGVEAIMKNYPNPEEINNDRRTAPSKRIEQIKPDYQKIFHGNIIALDNGIEVVLEKCPHFAEWVSWIKSLKPLV